MNIRNIDMEELAEKVEGFIGSRAWNALLMAFGGGCLLLGSKIVPLRAVGGIAAALGTVVLANEAAEALRDDDFDPECGGPYGMDCEGCACEGCCPWTFDPEDGEECEDPFDAGPEEDPEAPKGYDMSLDEGMYGPAIDPDDEGWEDGGDEGEEDEACSET